MRKNKVGERKGKRKKGIMEKKKGKNAKILKRETEKTKVLDGVKETKETRGRKREKDIK